MKRGWILAYTVFLEMVVFFALYYPFSFISIIFGIISGIVAASVTLFLLIYFKWAPNNLFFTFIPEGRGKIVVRGDAFKKALIQWEGHALAVEKKEDLDVWDIVETAAPRRFWGGLRFYGFWPLDDIYIYDFQWTGIKQNGELDLHPKETIDHVLFKDDVYACRVEKAEDKELLPLDIGLALTIRIINPYKALFNVQNWYEMIMNRIRPYVRDFITTDTYQKLIEDPTRIGTEVWERLTEQGILDEFKNRYGVELRKIEVKDIDPGEDYRQATLKKFLAEREKERIITEADAEKQRIKAVYEQLQEFGDLGKLIRVLEALEKSPGEGAKWIIPLPGMADFFARVFPGKESSVLSSDDIDNIRKIIEKFQQNNQEEKAS